RPTAGPHLNDLRDRLSNGDDYETAAESLVAILSKIVDTLVPAAVTAAIATSAINATSNAYSSRSWPSSSRTNDFTEFTSCMTSPFGLCAPLAGTVRCAALPRFFAAPRRVAHTPMATRVPRQRSEGRDRRASARTYRHLRRAEGPRMRVLRAARTPARAARFRK